MLGFSLTVSVSVSVRIRVRVRVSVRVRIRIRVRVRVSVTVNVRVTLNEDVHPMRLLFFSMRGGCLFPRKLFPMLLRFTLGHKPLRVRGNRYQSQKA